MNTFFCDITGTFDGEIERKRNILKLVKSLLIMCKQHDIHDLIFRFVTTDNMDTLLEYVYEFTPYIEGTPIRLTSQFSEHQRYKNGTIENIKDSNKIDQIRHISEKREVKRIFIADDSKSTQLMLNHILNVVCPDTELISFIPGCVSIEGDNVYPSEKKGIAGLIDCIDKYNEFYMEKSHGTK